MKKKSWLSIEWDAENKLVRITMAVATESSPIHLALSVEEAEEFSDQLEEILKVS